MKKVRIFYTILENSKHNLVLVQGWHVTAKKQNYPK